MSSRSSTDWLTLLTNSHQTYKKVKSTFEDLGIDVDEFVNVENASSLLSNPLISKSVFQKIEEEYGIPAEQAEAWSKKHGHKIEDWATFVEERMQR